MVYRGHTLALVKVSNLAIHLQGPLINPPQEHLNQPEAALIILNLMKPDPAIPYHLQPPKTLSFYLSIKKAYLSQHYLHYI